jgi:PIN domain nuclease of toxin-antitoxin system
LGIAEVILVDTHIVVWLALEPDLISRSAVDALLEARRAGGGVGIADISIWEIAQLTRKGRIDLQTPLASFLRSVESSYQVFHVNSEIAVRGIGFSETYPRDPADRLIGATAIVNGLKLVTKDEGIRASGEVNCIW